ncbi:hypothetical protein N8H74_21975 [Pseudomonas sp. B2M1-30]|uniref:Uncharacterized protein n=1 Tax=Pseudomonas koreensis TaxID=198620 RepID=A0A9X3BBM0_9PSED|nr:MULTISPECIES: hypothetical protein [Pseudomonas]MBV4477532.1 hypothetical protein [Pseudomonas botevensis]MCU0120939.1 hypothetical protein [Pseudomonas sp. B2M1-30]MCU7248194.1 hypothetical protein [Pseudomonas koreensis]MCU7259872.1 hypothetical protein [Pseudomonas koreensis]
MPSGHKTDLNLANVKSKKDKALTYIRGQILKIEKHFRTRTVIFLGESHTNDVDIAINTSLVATPPLLRDSATRVIFERLLDDRYEAGTSASVDIKKEKIDLEATPLKRSERMAAMIEDAFANDAKTLVYVVCGSRHGPEIFTALEKICSADFSYVIKPSVTD